MTQRRRAIRFEDLLTQDRCRGPVVSPDGRWVVFTVTRPDAAANRNVSHLHRVALGGGGGDNGGSDGATQRVVQLTRQGTSNTDPAFSPDGTQIAFTSNRGDGTQVWILPTAGGEARQVTRLASGAQRPVWTPDGKRLLVIAPVVSDDPDQATLERRLADAKAGKPKPVVVDELMFRHWDAWCHDTIDHLFAVDVATGEAVDLTPGPYPVPPRALTGAPDYAVSPDGSEVCFVSLRDDDQAVSTNANLWLIPIGGDKQGQPSPRRISPRPGANAFPAYSPDGTSIAYCGMQRPGYEADRFDLLIHDRTTGATRQICPGFDRSAGPPVWAPDGSALYFSAQDRAYTRIYRVPAGGGKPEPLTERASDSAVVPTPDGRELVFCRQNLTGPPEVYAVGRHGGPTRALTAFNANSLAELDLDGGEEFWYEGARGARVHGVMVKPPGFDPAKRYPVVFLIHGGPQGAFGFDFHERWNAQLFAAPGYVVVMLNPRGSTGYGQEFTDAIRGEWGGACYEDLTRGFDHVLASFPYCDPERTAAAGASFGGFMVNWIAGHSDRFQCLISHDGIFNTEMMDWATDELWFTEWEFEGTPWDNPEAYRRWSPHLHVGNMKTPMLVIQGEQDFRCPANEGLTLFTALRRRGVPARMVYFPDEGHWVVKPANRELWWKEVLGWLAKYLGEKTS